MRQLCLGKMDLLLHRKLIIEGYDDLEEALEPMIKDYRPKLKTTPHHCPAIRASFQRSCRVGLPLIILAKVVGSPRRGCLHTLSKRRNHEPRNRAFLPRMHNRARGIPNPPKNSSVISWAGTPNLRPCSSARTRLGKRNRPMSTTPQVLAWITCDSVYVDPATGKHTLLGIFSNLRAKEFPVTHPRMIWFLSFSDLTQGNHQLKISIGLPMSEEDPRIIIDRTFESPGPITGSI